MAKIEGENNLKADKEQIKATNRILISIIILLSLALGLTLWKYFELRKDFAQRGSEVEVLSDERAELQNELEEMLQSFDSLETDNDSMRVELSNRKQQIEELLAKVKDKDYAIYKLRKETKTLRTIMKGYVVTIDSLNTLNIGLRKENEEVRRTLSEERYKAKKLKQTNENLSSKVKIASRLSVKDVSVFGVKVKKDMTGKKVDRAKRTDKLRICFTIEENKVAPKEKKNLYLRIIAPDGSILTPSNSDEYRFKSNGQMLYYSDMKTIDYKGVEENYCMDWSKPDENHEVLPGKYKFFLFAEDYEMASFNYELK